MNTSSVWDENMDIYISWICIDTLFLVNERFFIKELLGYVLSGQSNFNHIHVISFEKHMDCLPHRSKYPTEKVTHKDFDSY